MGQTVSPEEAIRQIRQEKAAAGKRRSRYRQAAEQIGFRNLELIHRLGFASLGDLERTLMEKGVHPEGLEMFRKTLEKRGKRMPGCLTRIPVPGREPGAPDTAPAAPAPAKKASRVKFNL